MDAKTAFEVESALIDCFGLEHLANEIKGHDEDREMRWTDDLERQFTAKTFIEDENTLRFILIKINGYNINKMVELKITVFIKRLGGVGKSNQVERVNILLFGSSLWSSCWSLSSK